MTVRDRGVIQTELGSIDFQRGQRFMLRQSMSQIKSRPVTKASGDESDDAHDDLSEPDDIQGCCTSSPVYSHLNSTFLNSTS
jgi:hypothetical protein